MMMADCVSFWWHQPFPASPSREPGNPARLALDWFCVLLMPLGTEMGCSLWSLHITFVVLPNFGSVAKTLTLSGSSWDGEFYWAGAAFIHTGLGPLCLQTFSCSLGLCLTDLPHMRWAPCFQNSLAILPSLPTGAHNTTPTGIPTTGERQGHVQLDSKNTVCSWTVCHGNDQGSLKKKKNHGGKPSKNPWEFKQALGMLLVGGSREEKWMNW